MMIIWGVPKHIHTGGNEYLVRLAEGMIGPNVLVHEIDNNNYKKIKVLMKFVWIMLSTPVKTLILPSTATFERIFMQFYRLLKRDINIVVVCQDVWFIDDTGWRRLLRHLLRNSKIHYLCCSSKVAEAQTTYFGANSDLCYIANPATEFTNESLKAQRSDNILIVGSVIPRKNILQTVEVFCASEYSGKLIIVGSLDGDRDYVSRIEKLVEDAGKCDRVVFTGPMPKGELPALLADSIALVHFVKNEAYGMVMLEALCCGTPVLCHEEVAEEIKKFSGVYASDCLNEIFKKLNDPIQISCLVAAAESQSEMVRSGNTWPSFQKNVATYLYDINN